MTQHGDGNRWISNDQSQSLPSDTDFLDPCAVIDPGEQDETAWPYVRLNFFFIGIPAFELRSNLVNRQRLVAYIGQKRRQHLLEAFAAISPAADARGRNFAQGLVLHGGLSYSGCETPVSRIVTTYARARPGWHLVLSRSFMKGSW